MRHELLCSISEAAGIRYSAKAIQQKLAVKAALVSRKHLPLKHSTIMEFIAWAWVCGLGLALNSSFLTRTFNFICRRQDCRRVPL